MLRTVEKIGPVLDLFTVEKPDWGVSEVAAELGMPRSSAHGLLSSLEEIGLLQCRGRGRYRLGWRVVELSEIHRRTVSVRATASGVLDMLSDRWGETTHLAVMDRSKVLCVDKIVGAQALNVAGPRVGVRAHPHCSAVGKVLLAYQDDDTSRLLAGGRLPRLTQSTITDPDDLVRELESIRGCGLAVDEEECLPDISSAAAPIRDDLGAVVAAVSVTVPAARFSRLRAELVQAVRCAGAEITRRLAAEASMGYPTRQ
jgi:DNA-binding IclR family transcriptional regulator